jgi:hypothetical protein
MTSLDGLVMCVSSTAAQGVVSSDTRLHLRQQGSRILGRYAGGTVSRGCLVGRVAGSELVFRFAQVESSGQIHGGRSVCEITRRPDGGIRLLEHFAWRTRPGTGINVFDEV